MIFFDVYITETGNGGDIFLKGNDLAVVNSIQNMPYLALYGGNKETNSVTKTKINSEQSIDYWANNLLMNANPSIQFNSLTENTVDNVSLTSAGRVLIENAVKKDLEFFSDIGAIVEASVTIVSDNKFTLFLKIKLTDEDPQILIIEYTKQTAGDFIITDFNDDFLV